MSLFNLSLLEKAPSLRNCYWFQEFIIRQKTVNIDVDSHGRSCKERMLSVLWEEELADGKLR